MPPHLVVGHRLYREGYLSAYQILLDHESAGGQPFPGFDRIRNHAEILAGIASTPQDMAKKRKVTFVGVFDRFATLTVTDPQSSQRTRDEAEETKLINDVNAFVKGKDPKDNKSSGPSHPPLVRDFSS